MITCDDRTEPRGVVTSHSPPTRRGVAASERSWMRAPARAAARASPRVKLSGCTTPPR